MATFYEAFKIKNRVTSMLLKRSDVNAVGVGFANEKKPSNGASIIVYFNKNSSSASLSSLYSEISKIKSTSSIPIRLIPTGRFTTQTIAKSKQLIPAQRSRWRPVPGGVSIGKYPQAETGTAGVIVIKSFQPFILTNNHVAINNNATAPSIIQPGQADGGRLLDGRIGRAFEYVPFGTFPNMDAAIVLPFPRSGVLNPRYVADVRGRLIIVPGHLVSYPVGMYVWKSGRTTEITSGVVEAIGVNVGVNIPGTGSKIFVSQTMIRPRGGSSPTASGDSGAVWLKDGGELANYAATVHFATEDVGVRSISFPIDRAMRAFETRIARPGLTTDKFKAGDVKGFPPKNNFAYVQPLTKAQLSRIRVIRVK